MMCQGGGTRVRLCNAGGLVSRRTRGRGSALKETRSCPSVHQSASPREQHAFARRRPPSVARNLHQASSQEAPAQSRFPVSQSARIGITRITARREAASRTSATRHDVAEARRSHDISRCNVCFSPPCPSICLPSAIESRVLTCTYIRFDIHRRGSKADHGICSLVVRGSGTTHLVIWHGLR